MNVIQSAFYSPNLGEYFKYLLYGDWTLRKFFSPTEVQKHHQNRIFHHFSPYFPSSKAAFSDHQNTKIDQRTLLDAHGLKEVSESKQYGLTTHRKFFRASQSQRLDSLKSNFFESQSTLWK